MNSAVRRRQVEPDVGERDEGAPFRRPAHLVVEVRQEDRRVGPAAREGREAREGGGHDDPGRETVTGDVGDDDRQASLPLAEEVVEVAADRGGGAEVGRELDAGEGEVGRGEEPALEVARHRELPPERLGLGAGRHARLEVPGHLVEAVHEPRELVAPAELLADARSSPSDLGEPVERRRAARAIRKTRIDATRSARK